MIAACVTIILTFAAECLKLTLYKPNAFGIEKGQRLTRYATNAPPVQGAQWTGIVTQIAINMLESGQVDAVVCVQSQEGDRFAPKPVSLPKEKLSDV